MTGAAILIVDDEPAIRRFVGRALVAEGYRVLEAGTAADGLAQAGAADLVVLDLGLPDRDGLAVITQIRATSALPIVVLSARGDERGKVAALDLGADDYVTKPFGIDELMARIRTALRHRLQQQGSAGILRAGGLAVDLVRRLVTIDGTAVHLSPKEYELLAELAVHAGKVLTHRHLMRAVWGSALEADVQYLRVYMRQLRQKLEADPQRPTLLLTEPGVGYRLAAGD